MPTQIEVLASLQQVDQSLRTKTLAVAESEGRVAALEEAVRGQTAAASAARAELGELSTRQRAERTRLMEHVERNLGLKYEMIFKRRGGLAVVEVRSGICQGCRMRVPPQLYNEIQRNEQVILCPSCQRMLYWRAEAEEASG